MTTGRTARRSHRLLARLRSSRAAGLVRAARRAADLFPFTPLGLVTVGCSYVALTRFGIHRVDLLYLVIGAVGLGLAGISLLVTAVVAVGLKVSLWRRSRRRFVEEEGPPPMLRLECGSRVDTGFSLPSLWYVPMVRAVWSWVEPQADVRSRAQRRRRFEQVTPTRRGLALEVVRRIEIADAFALTRIAIRHSEARSVRTIPSIGGLEQIRLPRSISAGDEIESHDGPADGDRLDLRGYAPGDPIRFVLWKVYARTRELIVRTPERAVSPAKRAFAYLITGPGDEAAAGVLRKAVDSGALGANYVVGADGVTEDATTPEGVLDLLARSGSATVESGAGLAAFLRRAAPSPSTRLIVFAPAIGGAWRSELAAAAKARGRSRVHVVVCADGIDRKAPPSLARRLLVKPQERPDQATFRDVEELVAEVATGGAEVTLVDRARGHVYAGAQVLARRRMDTERAAVRAADRGAPEAKPSPEQPEAAQETTA